MDLLMGPLEDHKGQSMNLQEVMKAKNTRITCKVYGETGHSRDNYPKTLEDIIYANNKSGVSVGTVMPKRGWLN
jgi:hypothetical protein